MKISSTSLILCLYLVFVICIIQASLRQQNRSKRWDVDGDFGIVRNYEPLKNFDDAVYLVEKPFCSDSNEDCDNDQNNILYTMPLRKHEPMLHPPVAANFITKKSALQQRAGFMCSCEGKRIFRDLGMHYYPRYVPTIACKAGGCYAGFQCREKKYSVTVLKKKEMDDKMEKESAAEIVPDILKELFVPKVLTLGVSCECAP